MHRLKHEAPFRVIKILDMGYVSVLYFLIGIFLSKVTDIIFGKYQEEEIKQISTLRLMLEIILTIWFNMTLFYITRNVMELIPSPFHGLYQYDHSRLKEVTDTTILGLTYLYFQSGLRNRLNELDIRLSLTKTTMDKNTDFV